MSKTVLQRKILATLDFLLYDWLDAESLTTRERFADHNRDTFQAIVDAASEIAAQHLEPQYRVSDEQEPVLVGDRVIVPKETHAAWDAYVSFGFLAGSHDHAHGGMRLPRLVDMATRAIFGASGPHFGPAMLTEANASLLLAHATEMQQRVFALPELAGRWTGTMCLSESQAGSSLSDVTTRAVPDGPDFDSDPFGPRYRVAGSKMWISASDHDLTENIVHLVLAKIPEHNGTVAPGAKGISLFIVPKVVVEADASLGERNDVTVISLNHKVGHRGTPNAALNFGDGTHTPRGSKGAIGYLVGRPGDGLRQMFHMMNTARTEIGLAAAALGFAGYAVSLDYAKKRPQGRHRTAAGKNAGLPQVPIVEHADVKRMLLAQKAYAEGSLALALYAGRLLDEQTTGSPEAAAEASDLLEILTPIVKSWPSEWCLEANSLAIQVLGGAGYTRDFPVEMYWRDQRLNMIHEGTHGIQALDLLGRKVRVAEGAYLTRLVARIDTTIGNAREHGLGFQAAALEEAWAAVVEATAAAWSTDNPHDALANATPYMQGFGHAVLAWIHLDLAVAAAGSSHPEAAGRTAAMQYFFTYELPRVGAWLAVAAKREPLCRDLPIEAL